MNKKNHFAVQMKGKEMKTKTLVNFAYLNVYLKNRIFHSKFHLKKKNKTNKQVKYLLTFNTNKTKETSLTQHKTLL